jgi:hypothetical protein
MKIPILIEATSEQCYRAMGGEPFAGSVEAATPEAALEKMKKLIDDRVAQGTRIVVVDLPDVANPWLEGAGMFRDDPLCDDWQRAIADYRREANQIVDAP